MRKWFLFLVAFSLGGPAFGDELTLKKAQALVQHVVEEAHDQDVLVGVAVVDQHGNLKAYARMDGAAKLAGDSAEMKAFTAASSGYSTKQIAQVADNPQTRALADIPGFLLLAGGLPIMSADGEHLGGIGVGGASGDQDEQFAQSALRALFDK